MYIPWTPWNVHISFVSRANHSIGNNSKRADSTLGRRVQLRPSPMPCSAVLWLQIEREYFGGWGMICRKRGLINWPSYANLHVMDEWTVKQIYCRSRLPGWPRCCIPAGAFNIMRMCNSIRSPRAIQSVFRSVCCWPIAAAVIHRYSEPWAMDWDNERFYSKQTTSECHCLSMRWPRQWVYPATDNGQPDGSITLDRVQ